MRYVVSGEEKGRGGDQAYCFEEEVDYTVEEGHVCCYQCQDRFLDEHDEWTEEVNMSDCFESELGFVGFGMISSVPSLNSQSRSTKLQYSCS